MAAAISIHAPREGGDVKSYAETTVSPYFNPRPPRGGRLDYLQLIEADGRFQSTPPARGATLRGLLESGAEHISIHAPREGGDGKRRV